MLVTRSAEQAGDLLSELAKVGATALILPVLAYLPPHDDGPLRAALEQLSRYRWLVFTSAHAVACVVERLAEADSADRFHSTDSACRAETIQDSGMEARHTGSGKRVGNSPGPAGTGSRRSKGGLQALAGLRIAVVGPKTAAAVRARGLEVALEAPGGDAASLARELGSRLRPGERVLYPRAEVVSQDLPGLLRAGRASAGGPEVEDPVAYRTVTAEGPEASAIAGQLAAGSVHWVVAYSGSAVRGLLQVLPDPAALARVRLAAIGPATARVARELGLVVHAQAARPDARSLVAAMQEVESPAPRASE